MPSEPMIRVVLADDNLIVREGVRALLSIAGDVEVVGVAGRLRRAPCRRSGTRAPGGGHRYPDATGFHRRGHPRRAHRAQTEPGDGSRDPFAVRRAGVRDLAAQRRCGRLCVPAQRSCGRWRPAGPRSARGEHRRIDARPAHRRRAHQAGERRRWADRRRGAVAADGRRGQAHQGDRRFTALDSDVGRRRRRAALPQARATGERWNPGRARTPAHAPQGDHRPRGAGRESEPHAPRRYRAADARARRRTGEDRATDRDGADVRYPCVLDDCREGRTRRCSPGSSTSIVRR